MNRKRRADGRRNYCRAPEGFKKAQRIRCDKITIAKIEATNQATRMAATKKGARTAATKNFTWLYMNCTHMVRTVNDGRFKLVR